MASSPQVTITRRLHFSAAHRVHNAALSDAADADAGDFSTTPTAGVRVQLGNLTQASGSQTIQFAVTIN